MVDGKTGLWNCKTIQCQKRKLAAALHNFFSQEIVIRAKMQDCRKLMQSGTTKLHVGRPFFVQRTSIVYIFFLSFNALDYQTWLHDICYLWRLPSAALKKSSRYLPSAIGNKALSSANLPMSRIANVTDGKLLRSFSMHCVCLLRFTKSYVS